MYKKGDIVLLNFPFSNFKEFKLRPVLIWEDLGDDFILMPITSNNINIFGEYSIIKNSLNNLKVNSFLKIFNLNTVDKSIIIGKLGEISKKEFKDISELFCNRFCNKELSKS